MTVPHPIRVQKPPPPSIVRPRNRASDLAALDMALGLAGVAMAMAMTRTITFQRLASAIAGVGGEDGGEVEGVAGVEDAVKPTMNPKQLPLGRPVSLNMLTLLW